MKYQLFCRKHVIIMRAGGLASDPGAPAEVEFIRLRGGACSTADVVAQGDEFIAWRSGSRVACFGWITHGERQAGALQLTARPSTVYLYNFHTLPWARGRRLYTALLLQARYRLRSAGVNDLVIDAHAQNRPLIQQIATVSFLTLFNRWNIAGLLVQAAQANSIRHALVR
jgi:hypothetical protein